MADEELTQRVAGAAQSPADYEKTEVVPATPAPGAPADSADGEKTTRVGSQQPTTPPHAAPPPLAGPGQPHRAPAPPRQPYRPAASAPTPPPHVGPRGAAQPPPLPPQGHGAPPGYAAPPPPHQPYGPGAPIPAPHGYGPNTSQNPIEAANALLAKGNSLIARLMSRGIRGELIRQPWFLNIRQQSADPFVYITYGVGLLLAIVFALMPGVIGTLITDLVWAGLIYLYFALGTKLAHQFVAYAICGVGAALALLSALYTVTTLIDLVSLNLAGAAALLVIGLGVTVVSGIALAYVGVQVHRGIQRLSAR
jgi:hypothetical protein